MPRFPRLSGRRGVRDCTWTIYFLFQTLVGSSLITESKYHIKMIQNKTTTIVVFTVSTHTCNRYTVANIIIFHELTNTHTCTYSRLRLGHKSCRSYRAYTYTYTFSRGTRRYYKTYTYTEVPVGTFRAE